MPTWRIYAYPPDQASGREFGVDYASAEAAKLAAFEYRRQWPAWRYRVRKVAS